VRAPVLDPGACALNERAVRSVRTPWSGLSTQSLFDLLEVPQRSRNAGAARRLAKTMRELGWAPIKARGMTPGGFTNQVRGYAWSKTDVVMR
jgi:hypothetical protein